MAGDQVTELLRRISSDLEVIRIHTRRLARASYREDLERVATTRQRQQMWRLCDGTLSTEDIAEQVGISTRTVQYFVEEAQKAGLLTFVRRGYPKRVEDFDEIPSDWKPYRKPEAAPESSAVTQEV